MTFDQYTLFLLLSDQAAVTLEQLADQLAHEFSREPGVVVGFESESPGARRLAVRWGRWAFRLALETGPRVALESAEIAATFAKSRPDRTDIEACGRRIEVSADSDPHSDHLNDFLSIARILGNTPHAFLFCGAQKLFWDEYGGTILGE